MPYVTLDTLVGRFGEQLLIRLTDDRNLGAVDQEKVDRATAAANGSIDGYLRERYTLPLPEVPPELATAAEDLAMERVYAGNPERETPKDVKDRAAAAMTWLRDIKKGLATLSVATLPPAPGTTGETGGGFIRTNKTKADRIFTDDKLNSYTR